jgi:phage FluMu protein Com
MLIKSDVVDYLKKNASTLNIIVDESDIYNEFGEHLCSIDEYIDTLKLHLGCSFTSVYYSHATLENILRCNKCGTVIFTTEDEYYDPNLKCPTCTDYRPHFTYYSKKEIESNKDIQDTITAYEYMAKFEEEAYKYEKIHGHPYYEIFNKKIHTKKHMYRFELKCDDMRKSIFKGLHLSISVFRKCNSDEYCYHYTNNIIIPLSFGRIYLHWIYPHLGKCHKDFRSKYYIGKAREELEDNGEKDI